MEARACPVQDGPRQQRGAGNVSGGRGSAAELVASGENKLLTAYLQLHSKSPDQGLDLLQKLSKEKPSAEPAALLYRHYLVKVFKTDAKA